MTATSALQVITSLSDRALKILCMMVVIAQPVSQDRIRALYGKIGNRALHDALTQLAEHRLVTRTAYRGDCWIATPTARQLILGETSPREVSNFSQRSFTPLEEEEDIPTHSSNRLLPLPEGRETSTADVSRPQVIHKYPPLPLREGLGVRAVLAALDAASIRDPARAELVELSHVTPELITAHVASAPNLRMAIYRIRHNWKPDVPRGDPYLAYLQEDE